jgi:hypothetical protein
MSNDTKLRLCRDEQLAPPLVQNSFSTNLFNHVGVLHAWFQRGSTFPVPSFHVPLAIGKDTR